MPQSQSSPVPDSGDADDRALAALTTPSVDFLLLADRAESINGKLYIMGGAWDRLMVEDLQAVSIVSFALGILVPWNATNQPHSATLAIEDADGVSIGFGATVEFTQGRPAWSAQGDAQRVVLAMPAVALRFPHYGRYAVRAMVNGVPARTVSFTVAPPPNQPPHPHHPLAPPA